MFHLTCMFKENVTNFEFSGHSVFIMLIINIDKISMVYFLDL